MNDEGYNDPTAEAAVGHVMRDHKETSAVHAMKTIKTLQNMAHLAGFDIVGKIELREHKTGRVWK